MIAKTKPFFLYVISFRSMLKLLFSFSALIFHKPQWKINHSSLRKEIKFILNTFSEEKNNNNLKLIGKTQK